MIPIIQVLVAIALCMALAVVTFAVWQFSGLVAKSLAHPRKPTAGQADTVDTRNPSKLGSNQGQDNG